jgi:hypothetical protein
VLKEHIAPDCGPSSGGDDSLDEWAEVVAVEPGFFVGSFSGGSFGALGAFAKLGGFIAANVNDVGFECGDGFIDELVAEFDELWATWAGLETGKGFFAKLAAFFGVKESFEVAEEVDERDDLEGREFALEGCDLVGGDGTFSVCPWCAFCGESVFEVEAECGVSGVLSGGGELVEVVEGGGLFAGDIDHPDSLHGPRILVLS